MGEVSVAPIDTLSTTAKTYLAGKEGIPGQGPYMILILEVCGERIVDARFQTNPCPASQACGNFVAAWLCGKSIAEAASLNVALIEASIGKMPLGREHVPGLAVSALRDVLQPS